MSREPQRATIADLAAVGEASSEFWGERELPALRHPLLIHDFGETALVIRGEGEMMIAYLFWKELPAPATQRAAADEATGLSD
jgi:hypothetical protein